MRLEGKTAIVTGSSRGLGRAIALAIAREGADVLVNFASREEPAKEVAAAIEQLGRRAVLHRAAVSNGAQARAMVQEAAATFGRVDILVNASTAGQTGSLSGPAYCASKAGVEGLTKSPARAFARHNVLVNAIAPALIDTEIL